MKEQFNEFIKKGQDKGFFIQNRINNTDLNEKDIKTFINNKEQFIPFLNDEKKNEHKYDEIIKTLYSISSFMKTNLKNPVTRNPALFHYYYQAIANAYDVLFSLEHIFFSTDDDLKHERKLNYITIINELVIYYLYVKSKSKNSEDHKYTDNFVKNYMKKITNEQLYTKDYKSFDDFIVEIKLEYNKNSPDVLDNNKESLESLDKRKLGYTVGDNTILIRKK